MEFRILGTLEVLDDGRPVEIAGARQRALLALLLLNANEVVPSDRLVDGLWGERPPATAAKVLQNAVSQLRRSLGDELIATRAPGYVLRAEGHTIDARRFESLLEEGRRVLAAGDAARAAPTLRDALDLWRGRALEEFAYEPFAEGEIGRLEELRLQATEERIEADLALGRHADVVGELQRLVAEQPLRERLRAQLMLALYRSGRQAEALQAYQDGRRRLSEELGLDPGAALQELEGRILRRDPALEAPHARVRRATATARRRATRPLAVVVAAIALIAAVATVGFVATGIRDPAPTVVPDSLVKIDPKTGKIVQVFRVGGDPFRPTVVGDYVFVSSQEDGIVSRVDTRSGEIDTLGGLTAPATIAAGADGTFWLGSAGTQVQQFSVDDYEPRQLIEFREGSDPWFVAVGGGSVWVSHDEPPSVDRFDARTARLQRRYRHSLPAAGSFSVDVTFGERAAWAVAVGPTRLGRLLRVDALGGGSESVEVANSPYTVVVGFGDVWVTDFVEPLTDGAEPVEGHVLRIDAVTSRIDDVIHVGKLPVGLATGPDRIWVANGGDTTISEIDPRTSAVVRTIDVRHYPHGVAYGHGFLWASLGYERFQY